MEESLAPWDTPPEAVAPPKLFESAEGSEPAAPGEAPAARPFYSTSHLPIALAYTWCATKREFLAEFAQGSPLLRRLVEVRLTPDVQRVLAEYPDSLHLLAVAPEGLPDNPGVLPLWIRLAEACPRAEIRFAGEVELNQVDRLLSDDPAISLDGLELPQLLIFDEEWRPLAQWGPRPLAAESLLDEWLANHPAYELLSDAAAAEAQAEPVDPAAYHAAGDLPLRQAFESINQSLMLQMRIWYNSGLDAEASNELQALLQGLVAAE